MVVFIIILTLVCVALVVLNISFGMAYRQQDRIIVKLKNKINELSMDKAKMLDECLFDGVNKSIPSEEKPVTITDEDYLQKVKESEDYWDNRKMLTLIGMVQDLPSILKEMNSENEYRIKENIQFLGKRIRKAIDKYIKMYYNRDFINADALNKYDRPFEAWKLYWDILEENNLTEDVYFVDLFPKK